MTTSRALREAPVPRSRSGEAADPLGLGGPGARTIALRARSLGHCLDLALPQQPRLRGRGAETVLRRLRERALRDLGLGVRIPRRLGAPGNVLHEAKLVRVVGGDLSRLEPLELDRVALLRFPCRARAHAF